jgi:hypothetical protein
MSNKRVARAEKMLNVLAKRTGMTPSGMEWLKCAVDPFHDKQLMVDGYPDMASGNSIVQCLKQQVTIANPGVTSTQTWDCVIRTSNFLTNSPMDSYNTNNNQILGGLTGTGIQLSSTGGLEIFSGLTGQNLQFNTATNYVDSSIAIPDSVIKRRLRVVGQGFEVHNVTEELSKNGSVTTFQQEQSQDLSTWGLTSYWPIGGITAARAWGAQDVVQTQNIPASESAALLLGGSHTWDAAEGCYCVPTMQTLENPPKMASLEQPMFVTNQTGVQLDSGFPSLTDSTVLVPTIDYGVSEYNPGPIEMQFPIPWNSVGAYFTGLSPNTVLKVNYNVFLERFPSELDTDLIVLARPTAVFDSIALDAYAECMKLMPVGVPVCENGFGDWFCGGVASIVDKLTGTTWAGNLNRAANEIWSEPGEIRASSNAPHSVQTASTYTEIPRTVQIVSSSPKREPNTAKSRPRKPLPKIPQKKKPLPPVPKRS